MIYQRARRLLFSLRRIVKAMLEQMRLNQTDDGAIVETPAFPIS
jgi:hypothetical protein